MRYDFISFHVYKLNTHDTDQKVTTFWDNFENETTVFDFLYVLTAEAILM